MNSSENILPTYVLVAQMYSDTRQRVVNSLAGNVVLPTPDQDQQITWNAITQELGMGSEQDPTGRRDGQRQHPRVPDRYWLRNGGRVDDDQRHRDQDERHK